MNGVILLIGLWLLFAGTHMGLSSRRLRSPLVARLGEGPFLGFYSILALAIFVPLVSSYFADKHAGPLLWVGGTDTVLRWSMYTGMGVALTLVVGGIFTPSPASIGPGTGEVRGVLRITRHPLFMGIGALGLLHLSVARINLAELIFFGGLVTFSLIGCWHQDRRKLACGDDGYGEFYAQTAFLPFSRGGFRGLIERPGITLLGFGMAAALRYYHGSWFG
ncbi:NnrU family protein [Myxococcota bacterium]|nr:NnrU family protein [Myxococcota bacterium]